MTGRKGVPAVTAETLPHLHAFLSGYLHQDYALEHHTPAGALSAFLRDASAVERRALASDWLAFRAAAAGLSWMDERALFASLGGSWLPSSRTALHRVFTTVR